MLISDWSAELFSSYLELRQFQKINKETLTDVEIGAKWDWQAGGVRGQLNVAAFHSKYQGALQFFNVVATGIPQGVPDYPTRQSIGLNAADDTIRGIELVATVIPPTGLTLSDRKSAVEGKSVSV